MDGPWWAWPTLTATPYVTYNAVLSDCFSNEANRSGCASGARGDSVLPRCFHGHVTDPPISLLTAAMSVESI